jgi:hypothetical protein
MNVPTDPTLDRLTEQYRDSIAAPTATELDCGLDELLDHVASGSAGRRRIPRWSVLTAGLALSALAVVLLGSHLRDRASRSALPPLTYQIDGGDVLEGGYLRESGSAGMQVRFSEGSRLALNPGTRGRIRSVDKDGARLAIERGTASFAVTPSEQRRWLVDVGPFMVTVKGTVFTVAWDPLSEQFQLDLQHGRVLVSGPVSAGEIALRTGQRLVVNLAKTESVISEFPTDGHKANAPAAPDEPGPSTQPGLTDRPAAPKTPTVGKGMDDRRWSRELALGHWDQILADAKRMGVDAALGKVSGDDLFALADAARYRRQPSLARAALLAERRRFPDSPRALDAVFLLGRVEELREHGGEQALAWYEQYLAGAPSGPFAGEALGRKMTLTERLEGPERARPVAEEYLRRFPKGNYAGAARTLMRAP